MGYNIAIDGPAGAGKSTIAKQVAKKKGFIYVDTGAMYRAMALYVLEQNIDPQDQAKVAAACPDIDVTILYEDGVQQVLLNGKNVSAEIRQEIVGNTASKISVIKEVREKLVALQRQLAAKENVVMDGRDIGTQVLPDATVKIYLTASAKERAKRRYLELQEKEKEQDNDQCPILFIIHRPLIYRLNSSTSAFHLIIYSTAHRGYSLAGSILAHVFHDAGTCNIITVHIRQLSFQSAAGSDEVLVVFHGNHDNQSPAAFLVADAILVAHILCHPESILVSHPAHDDEHILHATLQLQLLQVEISRILECPIHIAIGIRNILRGVLKEGNRHIIRIPLPLGRQR